LSKKTFLTTAVYLNDVASSYIRLALRSRREARVRGAKTSWMRGSYDKHRASPQSVMEWSLALEVVFMLVVMSSVRSIGDA